MSALEASSLTVSFGGLKAVDGVSFKVESGEIVSIIGPNGAGKTTVFNAITGIYPPTSGEILIHGAKQFEPLTLKKLIKILILGFLGGLLTLISFNIQEVWQSLVNGLYVYRQPYDWGKFSDATTQLLAIHTSLELAITWLIGALVTSGGAYVFWKRNRGGAEYINHQGVARTFQNIRLFQATSAIENVLVGLDAHSHSSFLEALFRLPRFIRERKAKEERASALLKFVGLSEYENSTAGSLAYGHQRRLEIARALASNPKLLLLDEPAAGLNPSESKDLLGLIRKIRDSGITVVLIEHDMKVVMNISDRIVVLNYGRKIAEGTPNEIRNNPSVIEAYLGRSANAA